MTQTDYTESIFTESLTLLTPYQVWSEFFPFLPPWPTIINTQHDLNWFIIVVYDPHSQPWLPLSSMAEILVLPRLRVFSFTVVQGLEPVFKFETKSLDNETTTPSPPSPSHFLILWFIIFRLLSFALCLWSGIGNCWLDWLRILFVLLFSSLFRFHAC